MNYYNGVSGDTPHNGGSYISANKTGGEIYNFRPVTLFDESDNPTDEVCCFGYVQPSGNKINLERICGCNKLDNSKKIDNVLVIFCATVEPYGMKIVGWYSLAEVFRKCQTLEFYDADSGLESEDVYFFRAPISNCVLLPIKERESYSSKWSVPNATKDDIGFGRSNVWYADTIEAQDYVQKIVKQINEYDGENLIDEFLSED